MYECVNVHVCVCLEGVNNVHVTETRPRRESMFSRACLHSSVVSEQSPLGCR